MGSFAKTILTAGCVLACLGAALAGGVTYTSRTQFCMACHEMRVHQDEQRLSSHAKDAQGQVIGCSQCHIPKGNIARMLGAKAWMGAIDLWTHQTKIKQGETLDRAALQPVARRFTDDANCLACHEDLGKNAAKTGPVSEEGRLSHDNYLGKNGQARSGCVGCHGNLAHLPPFDERIPANSEFAQKIKEIRK